MVIFITLCFVLFLKQGIPSLAEICLQNRFSKDNEPFKAEKLFQTQGGPIILSQPVSFCTSMGHSAPVLSVYFHPNNDEHICSCDAGSEIRYWRITVAFVQECFKGHTKPIYSVCWDPSVRFLSSVSDDSVRVWALGA